MTAPQTDPVGSAGLEVAFTPGPWRVVNCDVHPVDGDNGRRLLDVCAGKEVTSPYDKYLSGFIDCGGVCVASIVNGDNREANARLISAAPDLLEACQRIEEEMAPAYHDCIDNGEPECAWCAVFNALDKALGR